MIIKPKPENYYEIQNARSSGSLNSNTLIKDLRLAKISIAPDWTVLDIGCRAGTTLNDLYKRGCERVYGIDIGANAENTWIAKKYPFLNNLIQIDVHKCNTDLKFDLITISHTLEHLYDPELVLEKMVRWLNFGGYLHSIVPIEPVRNFEKYDPHLVNFSDHEEHIQFYAKTQLRKIYDRKTDHGDSVIILQKYE